MGPFPKSIAVGDFNSDGKLDLVVGNNLGPRFSVLLNKGDGSFNVPIMYVTGDNISVSPSFIVTGDFNNDGKPDIATSFAFNNVVAVFLNMGNGTFGPVSTYQVGRMPYQVTMATGDFNGDGRLDLSTANYFDNTVSVLLNTGDGVFGPATDYAVGSFPTYITVGDFNKDGKLDLVALNNQSDNVSILLGTGTGIFGTATNFSVGHGPTSVAVSDFNGDGNPDLATANNQYDNVSVILGKGNGTFSEAINVIVTKTPLSIVVGDFNRDGKPDLATANNGDNTVALLYNCTVINNTPPQPVATANQITIVGVPFSLTVNAFMDAETSSTLTYSATINPANGLSFNSQNRTISGIPSTTGVSSVSITATDPEGASANTIFTITVTASSSLGFAIAGVTTVSCQTVTSSERRLSFTPQYSGQTSSPIAFSVVNELASTTVSGPYTLRVYTDNPTLILRAEQNGQLVSFAYNWLAGCNSTGPAGSLNIVGVTTVSCQTVTATERRLTFAPQYSSQSNAPITFSVVNELPATAVAGPYSLRVYTDNPTLLLKAEQGNQSTNFAYDWLNRCNAGGGRQSAELVDGLQVTVRGNPVKGDAVEVEVRGAGGQLLRLEVFSELGRGVDEQLIQNATGLESVRLKVGQPSGLYLLRVSTSRDSEVIKLIKP